ncbi:peptide deformylase [Companilactobacillus allii]|uniref:Peptide deformylase n=1 Tax=Companilactobacillus allii TaxID=1847728 RepID=A0A1P8Q286_9LACO|nr:peptide deformylase [Companilactobacillus allii]APX71946.1 peptide deformylase [Companilactobacillus allii]USQ69041.1 peptide deformylase [Companilactobacillus allii]
MIQNINHDTTLLSQKLTPATKSDTQVIQDLLDTLEAHKDNCVGMAANMIGVNKRILVFRIGMMSMPMINPVITKKSGQYTTNEGCLSLIGERSTERFQNIEVRFLDKNFQVHTQEFSDFVAEIIQHEMDHFDGVLI